MDRSQAAGGRGSLGRLFVGNTSLGGPRAQGNAANPVCSGNSLIPAECKRFRLYMNLNFKSQATNAPNVFTQNLNNFTGSGSQVPLALQLFVVQMKDGAGRSDRGWTNARTPSALFSRLPGASERPAPKPLGPQGPVGTKVHI